MKNFGILMALLVMSCGLLISSASAEPVRLPQIGDNSIDYYSIPDQPGSIGWQYTDDNDYTDLLPYMLNLSKIIDYKWSYKIDKRATSYITIANITIYRDGSFSTPKIVKSSSIPDYTQKVLDTLNSFAYLPPLPSSYNRNEFSVNLIFAPDEPTKEEVQKFKEQGLIQYLNATQNKLRNNWKPSMIGYANKRYRTALIFTIKKDGSLYENCVNIFQSSGSTKFDKASIKEIEKNSYAPLPEKYTEDLLSLIFVYDAKNIMSQDTRYPQLQDTRYPQSNIYNCFFINNNLRIFKNIQRKDGYVWLNAYKTTPNTGSYLWRTKVDCRNQLIGIKKSYAGDFDYLSKEPVLTNFNTTMQDINKNSDYKAIYDCVCRY